MPCSRSELCIRGILGEFLTDLLLFLVRKSLLKVKTRYSQGQNYVFFASVKVETTYSQGQNYAFSRKICGNSFSKSIRKGQNYVLLKVKAIYFGFFLNIRTMYAQCQNYVCWLFAG
jgi:hypothetical protein